MESKSKPIYFWLFAGIVCVALLAVAFKDSLFDDGYDKCVAEANVLVGEQRMDKLAKCHEMFLKK